MKLRQIITSLLFLSLVCVGTSLRLSASASEATIDQSAEVRADALLEVYVQSVAREIRTTWPKVKEIWPGADYDRMRFVMTDGEVGWRITTEGTTALTPAEMAALFKSRAKFSFQLQDGQDVVVLNLADERAFFRALALHPLPPGISTAMFTGGVPYDQRSVMTRLHESHPELPKAQPPTNANGVTQNFAIGVHEAFHHFVQKSWDRRMLPKHAGMRFEPYPAPVEPRVYRALLLENLYRAFLDPDNRAAHLSAAAYWNKVWKESYPVDYAGTFYTDVIEGTARYFDTVMQSVAMTSMDHPLSTKDRLIACLALTDDRESPTGPNPRMLRPGGSGESYILGAVAGLLADEMGLDWRKKTAEFIRPVEIILEKIEPVSQPPRPDIVSAIEPILRSMEAKWATPIRAFVARLKEPQPNDLLVLVDAKMIGSVSMKGSFKTDGLPDNATLVVEQTGEGALEDGHISLRKATLALVFSPGESLSWVPEGKLLKLAIIPLSSVRTVNGRIQITTDELTLDAKESKSHRSTYLGRPALFIQ